jgi:hypothetical protein
MTMSVRFFLTFGLLIATFVFTSTSPRAGDKKEPPKQEQPKKGEQKKEEPKEFEVNDQLINADLKDKVLTESYCKTYTYKMTKGKVYQIDMITPAFDAFLRLENPKGEQVAADDDSGGMLNARIKYRAPETGDFTICAMSLGGGSTGKFKLLVKELAAPPQPKATPIKLEKGQFSITTNLAQNDPKYNDQKIHKLYQIELEAGKTYQIDNISRAFDAYLYLEDADGKVLAEDDDGGDGLNSRIVHKAARAGTYRIVATSLGGGSTGEFTLSVRVTNEDK